MIHGQETQPPTLLPKALIIRKQIRIIDDLHSIGDVVPMRDHDSLRHARSARTIIQHNRLVKILFRARSFPLKRLTLRLAGNESTPMANSINITALVVESRIPIIEHKHLLPRESDTLSRIERGRETCIRSDQEPGPGVLELVRELPGHIRWVGTGEDATGHDDTHEDDGEEEGVSREKQYAVAWLETGFLETGGEALAP